MQPGEFGQLLHDFLDASLRLAPHEESELARRLREHLGDDDMAALPVLKRDLESRDHPNLQLALDNLDRADGWSVERVGVSSTFGMLELGLAGLTGDAALPRGMPRPAIGPVEYESVPLEQGRTVVCVVNAVLLMRHGDRRAAAFVARSQRMMGGGGLRLEVVAPDVREAEGLLTRIGELMHEHNVYRGRVLAFVREEQGGVSVQFRDVPEVERASIVLPPGTLDRIDRVAIGPARHRERLLAAGRHLKRGVLLHGPPGTGKTTTSMYLVAAMPGRTVLILTGDSLGLVEQACALARDLEPATVVLEDVDLVAQERMFDGSGPVLFELLNEMDGLAGDADVLFLLTTNRPDVLEPALAARPGRIDEAVELPLPDADGLRRLLALYSEGLDMRVSDLDAVIDRLDGATPAHIKELLRKAALVSAEEREGPIVVEDRHLFEALDDLSAAIDRIKRRLFAEDQPGEDDFPFPPDGEPQSPQPQR
jgi:hypothetical protein